MLGTITRLIRGRPVRLDEEPASGQARDAIQPLVATLTDMAWELREGTENLLECVLERDQVPPTLTLLMEVFGAPVKDFGEKAWFPPELEAMVDSRGGIMKNQCLFLRQYADDRVAYAAVWPWSNPERITLKLGVYDDPRPAATP